MAPNVTELRGVENLFIYGVYFIGGSAIGISNLIIFMAIFKYEALRRNKVYVLIMALSFADAANMCAYVSAGVRRTMLVFSGEHDDSYTAWQCAHTLHTIIWSFSVLIQNVMLSVVSLDRLLCVMFPLRYIGWTYKYTLFMSTLAYSYSAIVGVIGLVGTYHTKDDQPDTPIRCFANQVFARGTGFWLQYSVTVSVHPLYSKHFTEGPMVWASLSVVIYIVVWIVHKRHTASVNPQDQIQQRDVEHERKFTKSLAISCLCTLLIFIIPYQLGLKAYAKGYKNLPLILWTASNLNPFANVIIYLKRHREMRQAIKGLFLCKTMPADISVWKANNTMAEAAKATVGNAPANNIEMAANVLVEDL